MPDGGANEKEPWCLGTFVVIVEEWSARHAPFALIAPFEQILCHAQGDGSHKACAEQRWLWRAQFDLGSLLPYLLFALIVIMKWSPVLAAGMLDRCPPPRMHNVPAAAVVVFLFLHFEDAKWGEQARRLGTAFGFESLADSPHCVGRELRRGIIRGHTPEGCRGNNSALFPARREVVHGVHAALVASDDDKVISGQHLPASDARVVATELRARKQRGVLLRVLKLTSSPDDVAAPQRGRRRLSCPFCPVHRAVRTGWDDVHFEAAPAKRPYGGHLGAEPDVQFIFHGQFVEVMSILLACRMLCLQGIGWRCPICN
mmetsp:Transcript_8050/g.20645  ORF Transcript_8050/g.20645 Transcript_8050/m.20645 type:complete len:315 (+) Transcript_8050:215-1159(+)